MPVVGRGGWAGARLDRLKYDTILKARNSYKVSIAEPVGLSLKDKTGYPNARCNAKSCAPTYVCNITSITGLIPISSFTPSGDYSAYVEGWTLQWDLIPGGTVYNITQEGTTEYAFELVTPTTANFYKNNNSIYTDFIVYAHVTGCPDITGSVAPCFFHDAIVTMADGTTKAIEDVRVGDMI